MTLRLELFGGLRLVRDPGGAVVTVPRRRAALLALLAEAGGRGVARDKLFAYLWPESSIDQARHSLDQTLYELRREAGQAVFIGTNPVRLNAELLASDYVGFNQAIDGGAFETAVGLYGGPFLDGFFLSDAPEFERWVESTRGRMSERYAHALERLATQATGGGDHVTATKWWRAFAAHDPLRSRGAVGLMQALAASGDRAAALRHAKTYETLVRHELESDPDAEVVAVATAIRDAQEVATTRPAAAAPPVTAPEVTAVQSPPLTMRRRPPLVAWFGGAALLIAVLAFAARSFWRTDSRDPRGIAVLPFRNMSGEPNDEFLTDGVTEELTTGLTRVGGLHVMGRTSVYALKGSPLDPRQIGEILHVSTLVEGATHRTASRLRVTVRLIDAATGYQLWSGAYESADGDVWSTEKTVIREIARVLHVEVSRGENAALARMSSSDYAAQTAYLKGRFFWQKRSAYALRKALEYFNDAIARDSSFARAYSGMADAYTSLGVGNLTDDNHAVFDSARAAAEKALALDGDLAEAHGSLGQVQVLYALEWPGAVQSLARAQAIDSTYPGTYEYRTELYEWRGEGDRAVAESERGLRYDPLALNLNVEAGRALFFARRYDDAIAHLKRTRELDSTFARIYMVMGEVYSTMGRHSDAIREFQHAATLTHQSSRAISLLGAAYATSGDRAKAEAALEELKHRAQTRYVPALDFAILYVGLGDKDAAFEWLDKSYDDHSLRPYVRGPEFDVLSHDPRFARLLLKLHLEPSG